VRGQTSRETYPTRHSHINAVVIDSGWEGKAAKTLDDLADEGHVLAWVKNAFLDFKIPYTDKDGSDRHYLPDFIVHARLAGGGSAMVIVEVSGLRHDKTQKKWAVTNRWLPAVNAVRERHGWPQWDFIEVADAESVADLRNLLLEKLTVLAMEQRLTGVWAARREHELVHGPGTEDFELPERRVNDRPYVNPLD
jgi:type III restriction enzyme